MRDLDSGFVTALSGDILYPIYFFEMEFATGTLRLWTGIGDRIWDGKTWSGVGWIIGMSQVEETADTQATSLTLSLPANAAVISAALLGIRRNKPMTIWLGLLDASGAAIAVEEMFAGLTDISEIDSDPANPAVRIKYTNKIADFERSRVRRQTSEDQRIDYPDDKFFDFVGPLTDAVIAWGDTGS